ncbi:MAG: hypothetical protein ABSF84_00980 [Acidimicrobiales bacterium]|jgi:hypothetical protein
MNPMYAQLLQAVLTDEDASMNGPRSQGPLAELLRLRHAMEQRSPRVDPGWALQAVADQLAYDAALIRLARKRGVPVDIHSFDVPERGRTGLEQALRDKGVHLPEGSAPTIDPVSGDR